MQLTIPVEGGVLAADDSGGRRITAPGADHLIPLRVPDLVADVITEQVS